MRLFLVSDIHMECKRLGQLIDRAGAVDRIVCAGDLTNFGSRADAKAVTDRLRYQPLLTIPGNLDTLAVEEYLEELGCSIHGKRRVENGWTFVGFGGGQAGYVGDLVYTEDAVAAALEPLLKKTEPTKTILVTHQPPHDTKLDRVGGNTPCGSTAIRRLIEQYRPAYQICGHIHESWGEDHLGVTRCFNIAAVKEGRAAVLDLATGEFQRLIL